MTEASAHNEQVKDFVRTEMFESGVEEWELQCIYDATDGVNDTAGKEPVKSARSQGSNNALDRSEANPAHGDIDHRREPFRTVDPESIDHDADDRDEPDQCQKAIANGISKDDQTDRSISAGDQYKDHHMIDLFKEF